MFNLGAGEVLVILLLALIVLGPQRLPEAARQVGRFTGEIRKLSNGFQQEMRTAFEAESEEAARARGAALTTPQEEPATETAADGADDAEPADDAGPAGHDGGVGDVDGDADR